MGSAKKPDAVIKDHRKTKKQLLEELAALRLHCEELRAEQPGATDKNAVKEQLREALLLSEKEKCTTQAVIDAVGCAISIHDRDFRIVYQNGIAERFAGRHIGEYCYMVYERTGRICDQCPVEKSFKDGLMHSMERCNETTGNGTIYVEITSSPLFDSSGGIYAVVEAVKDITSRKKAEAVLESTREYLEREVERRSVELRNAYELLAEAQRIARIGSWTWDIVSNELVWSDDVYLIFGLSHEEFRASYDAFLERVHPDDREFVKRSVNETIHEKRPYSVEHRIVLPDGRQRIVHGRGAVKFNSDGAPVRMSGTIQDITEERDREVKLIIKDRLASIGEMAATVAHELNNPLATIASCTQGLLARIREERPDTGLFSEYLNIIEEEVFRCKGITTNILSLVKKDEHEGAMIDIHNVIYKCLNMLSIGNRMSGIKIKKSFSDELPLVSGHEGEMIQAFMAIISNAIEATGTAGQVEIRTAAGDCDTGRCVVVDIIDEGCGISSEHLNRIFDPFFTTKSTSGSAGLGLSIARRIILSNKGNINLTTALGKGTAVKTLLPV